MSDLPWTWFVMRSSGLVAVGLLTVSVVLGLIGPRLRPAARLTSIGVHRASSVAGTLLLAAHIGLAILDPWIVLDWPAAFVPGIASWERWGVALGALAVDLLLVVIITTATRMRAPRLWRRAHLLAYPVWVLAVGHGLLVGTDAAAMRALAIGSTAAVLAGVAIRLLVRTGPTPPPTPSRVRLDVGVGR
jgi:methionine sulfoxide reductase heme-binding subunit